MHGIEAALRNRKEWLDTWDEHRFDVDEVATGGDTVVAFIDTTARGKSSGVVVDIRFYAHLRLRDDKVVFISDYADRVDALEAAGLRE